MSIVTWLLSHQASKTSSKGSAMDRLLDVEAMHGRLAAAQMEVQQAHAVVALLVQRLGGSVLITDFEVVQAKGTIFTQREGDATRITVK